MVFSKAFAMQNEKELFEQLSDLADELDKEGVKKEERIHEMTMLFLRNLGATVVEDLEKEDVIEIHFTDEVSELPVVLKRKMKNRRFSSMKEAFEIINRVKNYYPRKRFDDEDDDDQS